MFIISSGGVDFSAFTWLHNLLNPETLAGLYEQPFQYKTKTKQHQKPHNFTKAHDINQGSVINQVNVTHSHCHSVLLRDFPWCFPFLQ